MNGDGQESLRGVIERITFHNEENGYTVAKLALETPAPQLPRWQKEASIVGAMVGVNVGEAVELQGRWEIHPQYGKQFSVSRMRTLLPATVAGIERYLGSGLIRGVGPVTAKRVVAKFGERTLDVIDDEPERLSEVDGVGRKRLAMIRAAWSEMKAIKEVMIFLQGHGVSAGLAAKIYKRYGDGAVAVVQQDPYRLAEDIFGIGFVTADKIAGALGIEGDAPQRIAAGVAYTLEKAADEGHVYLPGPELVAQSDRLLEAGREKTAAAVLRLEGADRVKLAAEPGGESSAFRRALAALYGPSDERIEALLHGEQAVYLSPIYFAEVGVANRLARLAQGGGGESPGAVRGPDALNRLRRVDWERKLAALEGARAEAKGLRLVPRQKAAVRSALTHRLTVLTGGPGTGKTTVVRTILDLCEEAGAVALLAAPTGRAAKRMAEATGRAAKTVHRLLEFQPSAGFSFKRNEEHPLRGDLLIVDEASMLDLLLTNSLLKAVPPGMSLLLVGDVDQLPSVGAGNVLGDLIAAIEESGREGAQTKPAAVLGEKAVLGEAAVVRLETIFRQAAGSYIVENAHRINRGQMPILTQSAAAGPSTSVDFFLFRTGEPERASELCVELVQERIPRRFGIAAAEIQVLSPMHRGAAGVGALNETLQGALNPPRPERAEQAAGSRVFRVGDRVMQVRNNYDKDVFNGDMGYIKAVDGADQRLSVEFDRRHVPYDFLDLDELVHAYAISVHKSQGSEFPAVVVPLLTSHYMMLRRNLLYTAVTRAQRLVVLVGQPRAIEIAVGNDKEARRYSGLTARLLRNSAREIFA